MITNPFGKPEPPEKGTTSSQTAANAEKIASMRGALLNLYDQEYLLVVRFVMRLGASLHDAEDAAQEAFTDALASLTSRPEKWAEISDPRGWIRAIARNKYLRPPGNARHPLPVPVADVDELVDRPPHAETRCHELSLETLHVLDAMRKLDPLPRTVLAFHMDGFSGPEIAAHLGLRDDQEARDLLKKARKTLARELAPSRDREERSET